MVADSDGPFVVVTGDPNLGRGERLSRARSHLTSRYHRQRRQQSKLEKSTSRKNQGLLSLQHSLSGIPNEVSLSFPAPQLSASPTGYSRMWKFMYEYVHYSHQIHPFFSTVICAAISHPALMSSKILNASAWDDLSTGGEISGLTLQQCAITRRMLSDSLSDSEEACSDVTIAALVALVLFDLVNDEIESLHRDRNGIHRIISLRGGVLNLGFDGHLRNSLLLIDLLQRAVGVEQYRNSLLTSRQLPTRHVDMNVFQLGNQQSDIDLFILPLSDLYQTVTLSRCGILFEECVDYSYRLTVDARMAVLEQASLVFRMTMTEHGAELAYELSHLKHLLQQTDLNGFWGSLPGALIWCLVIGARLSQIGSQRKWFMMQTTRVTCAMGMNSSVAVLENLRIIVEGLDKARISGSGASV